MPLWCSDIESKVSQQAVASAGTRWFGRPGNGIGRKGDSSYLARARSGDAIALLPTPCGPVGWPLGRGDPSFGGKDSASLKEIGENKMEFPSEIIGQIRQLHGSAKVEAQQLRGEAEKS